MGLSIVTDDLTAGEIVFDRDGHTKSNPLAGSSDGVYDDDGLPRQQMSGELSFNGKKGGVATIELEDNTGTIVYTKDKHIQGKDPANPTFEIGQTLQLFLILDAGTEGVINQTDTLFSTIAQYRMNTTSFDSGGGGATQKPVLRIRYNGFGIFVNTMRIRHDGNFPTNPTGFTVFGPTGGGNTSLEWKFDVTA